MARLRIPVTLATSLVLHVAFWAFVLRAQPRPPANDAPREDPWTGNGLEVDAIREPQTPEKALGGPVVAPPPAPPPEPETQRKPAPAEPAAPNESPPNAALEPDTSPDGLAATQRRPARAKTTPATSEPMARPTAPPSASLASGDRPQPDSSTPSASESAPGASGVFGAAGLPPGVRHLALAFARALPKGAHTDSAFRELPLGELGEARIRLRVDEDGKLGPLEFVDERARDTIPAPIVRMLENALRLLSFGRFSLSSAKLEPGVLSMRVRVEISEEAPSIAENAQPHHVRELKGPASGAENPKRAWFVLNSGRRVDAWVHDE